MEEILHPAYIAGLADSDGSFTITIRHKVRPVPHYYACFQLSWKQSADSLKTLNAIKNKYGGAVYNVKGSALRPPMYKYMCGSAALELLINDCLPYLQLKREQAATVMQLRNTIASHGNKRSKPQELIDLHHSLYLKMKELNTKNSGDRSYESN